MAARLDQYQQDFEARFAALLAAKREADVDVGNAVAAIIEDIRQRGDAALLDLTSKYDRLQADSVSELAVSGDEVDAALDALTPALRLMQGMPEHFVTSPAWWRPRRRFAGLKATISRTMQPTRLPSARRVLSATSIQSWKIRPSSPHRSSPRGLLIQHTTSGSMKSARAAVRVSW